MNNDNISLKRNSNYNTDELAIHIYPALNITKEQLGEGLDIIIGILKDLS